MTTFLFHFHSGLRWVLVLAILIGLIRFAMIWLRQQEFSSMDATLGTVITALLDVQLLLGFILLYMFSTGFSSFHRFDLEHATTMLLAVLVAHLTMRWKKLPGPLRARNSFFTLLAVIILVIAGVMRLPQGWHF